LLTGVGARINILKLEIYKCLNKQCNAKSPMSIELCTIKLFIIKNRKMETKTKKSAMDFKIKGNWETQAKALKKKFPELGESDLKLEKGKEMELVSRLAKSLNKKTEEVINIIKKGQIE
jgi:hypothetical protein